MTTLLVGLALVGVATVDLLLVDQIGPGDPLPVTVRIPAAGLFRDTQVGGTSFGYTTIVHPRGAVLDGRQITFLRAFEEQRRPPGAAMLTGMTLAVWLLLFLFTSYLRRQGRLTGTLRTQLSLASGLLVLALASKAMLLMTSGARCGSRWRPW